MNKSSPHVKKSRDSRQILAKGFALRRKDHLCLPSRATGFFRIFGPGPLNLLFLSLAVLAFSVPSPSRATPHENAPQVGEETMARYFAMPLDEAFAAVATGIHFEPYAGVMRGPTATALARAGNATDQALLLAELLTRKGYRVRFVQGLLVGDNLRTLLRGLYPPILPEVRAPKSFNPYVPGTEPQLEEIAADHVWLEVAQPGGDWLPLDPSFPRAKIGEAYAEARTRYEQLPESMYHRLRVSVHEQLANGSTREVGHVEGHVADLALQPMFYLVLSAPQVKRQPEKPKRGAVDMFGGALSGDEPTRKKANEPAAAAQPMGIRYRRALYGAGSQQPVVDSLVLDTDPGGELDREWLQFELFQPNGQVRTIERDTYLNGGPHDIDGKPADYRRYNIAVSAGPLSPEVVAHYARTLGEQIGVATLQKQLDDLRREAVSADTAERLSGLEEKAALLGGHVAAMSLSAEVSELTRRIAFGNALTYAQTVPAITIISLEGGGKTDFELGADLRLDEVEAWPYPGAPSRAVELFQGARGIQATVLEGFYIEKLVGKKGGANALALLTATNEGPSGWLVLQPGQNAQLSHIAGLTPAVRHRLEAALDRGREIIITAKPVELAGRQRLGWWERDRATGRVIGVIDDGRHGMTEYTLNTEKIGLNENMGYVVGALVGAVTTEALLAAKVLEEGEITQEAIAEIEKMMEQLQCLSCPKAEAKAQVEGKPTLACLEIDNITKVEKGLAAGAKMDFCENYVKGLKCATSFILDGYKNDPTGLGDFEYKFEPEVKVGCVELYK